MKYGYRIIQDGGRKGKLVSDLPQAAHYISLVYNSPNKRLCCRKISSFLKMQRSYLLAVFIQMLLEGLPCSADRACEFNDSKFFIGDDDKAEDVSAGECSFGENFCGYSVTCTDKDAKSWSSVKGQAVSQGKNGKYEAFSVLLSPLLNIEEEVCLEFNYSQSSPGRLSVFLATSKELVYIKPEELGEGNFSRLTNIKPSVGKIGFRARSPNEKQNVSLWDVSLVKGSCRSVPACSSGSDDILLICAWNVEQDGTSTAGSGSRVGDRYSGIIAGTLLFLVVVIVIFLVGFFHWRQYVKQESRNKNDDNKARVVNDSRNPVAPAQRNPAGGHRSYETMHRSEGEDNHAYAVVDVADVRSLSYLQNVVRKEREHNNSNTAIYEDSLPHQDKQSVSDVNDGYNYATPTNGSLSDHSKASSGVPREANAYSFAQSWEPGEKGDSRTPPVPKSGGEEYNTLKFDGPHPGANLATKGDAYSAYSHITPGDASSYDRVHQTNSSKNKVLDSHYSHVV